MKMASGLFWGIIVILIGLSILLKGIGLTLPLFKIIIGGLLIYLGLKFIFGGWPHNKFMGKNTNDVFFAEAYFSPGNMDNNEYNIIFGKGVFDLRGIDLTAGTKEIKIHTVFGRVEMLLDKNMPFRIISDVVFGGVNMPNGNSAAFGTIGYSSDNFNAEANFVDIKADVVFGGIDFKLH